jgi:hypothetical protein
MNPNFPDGLSATVLSISALRLVGATAYWPECSRLLRLYLRLGSLSKVVMYISSIVISERTLYPASPACPSSGRCRSSKRSGHAEAKDYLLH